MTPEDAGDPQHAADRPRTGHHTIWREEENHWRIVGDLYDPDAAGAYVSLLNVVAAANPLPRFHLVREARFWTNCSGRPVPEPAPARAVAEVADER